MAYEIETMNIDKELANGLTATLRKLIRDEIINVMNDMPAAVDDTIQNISREVSETVLDDELNDRITTWMNDNLHGYLKGKIRVVID